MKNLYILTLTLFFPLISSAQQWGDHSLTLGFSTDQLYFPVTRTSEIIGSSSSYRSSGTNSHGNEAWGLQLGYNFRLTPLWEASLRGNYSGDKHLLKDNFLSSNNLQSANPEVSLESTRKYRTVWSEILILWSAGKSHSRIEIQYGSGVSYIWFWQEYRSGFGYHSDTRQIDYQIFARERINSWGVPLIVQARYPINDRFRVGALLRANIFFRGQAHTGFTLIGVYKL